MESSLGLSLASIDLRMNIRVNTANTLTTSYINQKTGKMQHPFCLFFGF